MSIQYLHSFLIILLHFAIIYGLEVIFCYCACVHGNIARLKLVEWNHGRSIYVTEIGKHY